MTTADDFDTGTRAAVAGGVTTFIDYTTPAPGQGPLSAFKARRKLADPIVRCDYSLHNVLIGWKPQWKAELAKLVKLGVTDVAVLKGGTTQWKADQYPLTNK